jgi:hypothetical protein
MIAFYGSVKTYANIFDVPGFGVEAARIRDAFARRDVAAMTGAVCEEMVDEFAVAGRPTDVYMGDVRFDLGYIATDCMAGKHLRPKTNLLGAVAEREWFFAQYEALTAKHLDRQSVRALSVLGLASLMAMTYKGLRRYEEGATRISGVPGRVTGCRACARS